MDLQSSIISFQTQVKANRDRIAELEEARDKINSEIAGLEENITKLDSAIANLNLMKETFENMMKSMMGLSPVGLPFSPVNPAPATTKPASAKPIIAQKPLSPPIPAAVPVKPAVKQQEVPAEEVAPEEDESVEVVEEETAEEAAPEEDEEEVEYVQIKIGKKDYLIDEKTNTVLDIKTQEEVGKYDPKLKKLIPL